MIVDTECFCTNTPPPPPPPPIHTYEYHLTSHMVAEEGQGRVELIGLLSGTMAVWLCVPGGGGGIGRGWRKHRWAACHRLPPLWDGQMNRKPRGDEGKCEEYEREGWIRSCKRRTGKQRVVNRKWKIRALSSKDISGIRYLQLHRTVLEAVISALSTFTSVVNFPLLSFTISCLTFKPICPWAYSKNVSKNRFWPILTSLFSKMQKRWKINLELIQPKYIYEWDSEWAEVWWTVVSVVVLKLYVYISNKWGWKGVILWKIKINSWISLSHHVNTHSKCAKG